MGTETKRAFDTLRQSDLAYMLELPPNHYRVAKLMESYTGPREKGVPMEIPVGETVRIAIHDQLLEFGMEYEAAYLESKDIRDKIVADIKSKTKLGLIIIQRGVRSVLKVDYRPLDVYTNDDFVDERFVSATHIVVRDLLNRTWANLEARIRALIAFRGDPEAVKQAIKEAEQALVSELGQPNY